MGILPTVQNGRDHSAYISKILFYIDEIVILTSVTYFLDELKKENPIFVSIFFARPIYAQFQVFAIARLMRLEFMRTTLLLVQPVGTTSLQSRT